MPSVGSSTAHRVDPIWLELQRSKPSVLIRERVPARREEVRCLNASARRQGQHGIDALDAARRFRRVKGHRDMSKLVAALRALGAKEEVVEKKVA